MKQDTYKWPPTVQAAIVQLNKNKSDNSLTKIVLMTVRPCFGHCRFEEGEIEMQAPLYEPHTGDQ